MCVKVAVIGRGTPTCYESCQTEKARPGRLGTNPQKPPVRRRHEGCMQGGVKSGGRGLGHSPIDSLMAVMRCGALCSASQCPLAAQSGQLCYACICILTLTINHHAGSLSRCVRLALSLSPRFSRSPLSPWTHERAATAAATELKKETQSNLAPPRPCFKENGPLTGRAPSQVRLPN